MKKITHLLLLQLFVFTITYANVRKKAPDLTGVTIPLRGNVFKTNYSGEEKASVFFRIAQSGKLCLYLKYQSNSSEKIQVTCTGRTFTVHLKKGTDQMAYIGCIEQVDSGYVRVDIPNELENNPQSKRRFHALLVTGSATEGATHFVHDFSPYWGMRGPSVHLNFQLPENEKIEWFYNEITVPKGADPIGSYYMANGFGEGYFGIQINSHTERRILFSVWSPFSTNNPNEIPEDQRIRLLAQGENVHIGTFGNEGSGGQSYLVYPWKTGNTYKFLTHIKPDGNGATEYTAYFYTPDEQKWLLIASFSRPLTNVYYTKAHSFLENFSPANGYLTRKAFYANQWACTTEGNWISVASQATFTVDDTGRKGARMDYKGGIENDSFFLQNGGFFSDYTPAKTIFRKQITEMKPDIDFNNLPQK